ncbi:MAG: DUF3147 family protein [Opitutaceae bacterium]
MAYLVVKYAVTALVIVIVFEVAKRCDRAGALIASLPLVTVLAMIWLHVEKQPEAKIANHAYYTFWYVLPTMPMFLLMPWMIKKAFGFWPAPGAGCVLTVVSFGHRRLNPTALWNCAYAVIGWPRFLRQVKALPPD